MFGLKPPRAATPDNSPKLRGRFTPDQCDSCHFYLDVTEGMTNPVCRRFPPTSVLIAMNPDGSPMTTSHFPLTNPNMWCGEYQRRSS